MVKDVAEFCKSCETCQRVNSKFDKQRPELHPIPVTDVWKRIGIDLIGPLPETPRGNKYIITATDYFSKWPEATALPDKTALGVADFLISLFCRHGWPEIVQSDQGREFVNEVCTTLFELTGIQHRISSAYHPQTNGLDERTNQTLVRALIKLTSTQQEQWDLYIDSALYSYRISRQDSSKYSPYFLMYNRHPRKAIDHEVANQGVPAEDRDDEHGEESGEEDDVMEKLVELREHYKARAATNIQKAQERQKNYYDAKHDSNHVSDFTYCNVIMLAWLHVHYYNMICI